MIEAGIKRQITISLIIFASLVLVPIAHASLLAENFVLLDQQGVAHELHYNRDAKAIVLISQGNGCQVVRSNLTDYQALRNDYADKGVHIMMINANLQDSREKIVQETKDWGFDFPILKDDTQLVARALEINRTGEALIIDPRSWQVVYRGPLSDRVGFERQKNRASKTYVRDVLDELLEGVEVEFTRVNAPGCIINIEEAPKEPISYAKTIAPILQTNCMACHVEGGIAPWAMSNYTMVKGFSPMIREVLRTKRMPPWHADPEIGHWQNDVSLSNEDIVTLINWIESGSPRGEGKDPLESVALPESQWPLGEPDLVIDIPEFEIPATGVVDYQFPVVKNPLDRGVWIEAAAIIPGDTKAVHHILAGSSANVPVTSRLDNIFENIILTYAPGNETSKMPESTGVYVAPGGVYQFQMHYTPYGKKTVDRSKLGLYFAKEPPKHFYREHVVVNMGIRIPANDGAHQEKAYFRFPRDAELFAFFPHAHYRGKSSEFELIYPDGKKETLLSVPNYDFNWQRTYRFSEPKIVPAGSLLMHRTIYDNSANNLGNPAPDQDVFWGLQSEEEMLYGSFGYRWLDETSDKPRHDSGFMELSQAMGFMDQNVDGLVSKQELPPHMLKRIGDRFSQFDVNDDGGLGFRELAELFKAMRSRQKASTAPKEANSKS
ncbi:MAG: redoxin domain-containing protein [Gammaproteobacteria bacterium]|nr:redoxin domain-containing protein [Gammaproteobacteria bacterium]